MAFTVEERPKPGKITVCFIVRKTTSELEHAILTILYFAGAENTDSWCARKGELQGAFLLDVLMVHFT
jgi:hypothetical protein